MVTLKIPHEGEMQENMLPMGSDSQKRECEEEGEDNIKMSKKWAKRVDYCFLDDPYVDKFDLSFTMSPLGEPESLEEAKRSPEQPEWEKAIKIELDQLTEMGTWNLVNKPTEAVPISNKWVLLRYVKI